jgi:hypothetical protein
LIAFFEFIEQQVLSEFEYEAILDKIAFWRFYSLLIPVRKTPKLVSKIATFESF